MEAGDLIFLIFAGSLTRILMATLLSERISKANSLITSDDLSMKKGTSLMLMKISLTKKAKRSLTKST